MRYDARFDPSRKSSKISKYHDKGKQSLQRGFDHSVFQNKTKS